MLEITTYKNYKELCKAMGWKITNGSGKKRHLKLLDSLCKYHKEGNKFVIDEVFENPIPIKDGRVGNFKNYPQFKVNKDKWYNKGVYMIKLDNQVYIGSTVNFRERFIGHRRKGKGGMEHTQELLNNGGEFFILHDMNDVEDIELIRQVEEEYILFYTHETDYDVVNRRMSTLASKEPKIKYKSIRVEEEHYKEILELLKERGYSKYVRNNYL